MIIFRVRGVVIIIARVGKPVCSAGGSCSVFRAMRAPGKGEYVREGREGLSGPVPVLFEFEARALLLMFCTFFASKFRPKRRNLRER